ncbi:hypothetical protein OJAV_G00034210 [Oryzias javanicus]|uniref:Uncharacterized protein n=1 Tax=Oryzias javanicus TaxID=123683 RepID=A0A437DFU3_ORYJA|nr:hypothetical protein OJAV_G00034210 [Oryzias javanicus]
MHYIVIWGDSDIPRVLFQEEHPAVGDGTVATTQRNWRITGQETAARRLQLQLQRRTDSNNSGAVSVVLQLQTNVSSQATDILKDWLKNMYGSDSMITNIWNTTMIKMNCCGCVNDTDFLGSKFEAQNQGNLPPSCCMTDIGPCSRAEAEHRLVKVS